MTVMSTIDLNLPEELRSYVNEQVASRGYTDASEFVQALLEAERHRSLRDELETTLLEAADGPFSEWTDADVEDVRRVGRRLIERRNAP
jgi:antitoxin ParD1/3/4